MRKNIKVYLSKAGIDFHNPKPQIVAAIHLARLTNALRAKQRLGYLLHMNDGDVVSNRSTVMHFDLLLHALASIFETLKKMSKIENEFHILKSVSDPAVKAELHQYLDYDNNPSPIIPMAKYVRNKMIYHFDDCIVQANFHKYAENSEIVLLSGETDRKLDAHFSFVDDLLINDIIDRFGSRFTKHKNVYDSIALETFDFLDAFSSAAEKAIMLLLEGHVSGTHETPP